jgi:hypothetical protein
MKQSGDRYRAALANSRIGLAGGRHAAWRGRARGVMYAVAEICAVGLAHRYGHLHR